MAFELAQALAVLERTPSTLRALLEGLPDAWLDATEGPGTWSPRVVAGHLVHAERTDWIPRARVILARGADRRFPPFDRTGQLHEPPRPLTEVLDEFARLRTGSLATLAGWRLTEAELGLEGIHPEFGAVTLRQLLATWTVHDLGHLAQCERVMAGRYREAIGPWRAYLPIVGR